MKPKEKYPEVRELLKKLIDRDFVLTGFDDGSEDDLLNKTSDLDKVVKAVHSVDECQVELEKDDKNVCLYFVMGNEPGVALADYSCDNVHMKVLDKLSEEIYNK